MPSMVVIVTNESLDSAVERGPVFIWLDVNILVFYRFPKSFNPNIVFGSTASVHADTYLSVPGCYVKKHYFLCRSRKQQMMEEIRERRPAFYEKMSLDNE